MKALILVGGYGTRLRPLTFTAPKPLVPFANVPISLHQIRALVKVGVKKIVLAVNVQPEAMLEFNRKISKELGVEIICSQEDVPMGTAGPLALAREHLTYDDSPFFMFNSDVICDFPLADMLAFHRAHGGEGSILVTEVKDPSKYGVVLHDDNGRIREFVEKPQVYVGNKINAGIYLFNPSVIKRVPLRPTSIEREIFPAMASESQLYCKVLQGYWMDIGQPKDYLAGTGLHLAYVRKTHAEQLATGANIIGNVLIDATAKVSASAVIGPDVVVGPGVVIDDHARVKKSTLLANVRVKASALVHNSLIGWDSTIGSHAHVESSVLGADVQIANEITVNEVVVCPHKGVGENTFVGKIIM